MSSRQPRSRVITFYSFKGGTGRSMALANVACLLAQEHNRVLMIDWDLEAPGLHRYFRNQLQGETGAITSGKYFESHPGLIDLFRELAGVLRNSQYMKVAQDPEEAATLIGEVRLENYILPTDLPELFLLNAGCFDESYPSRVNDFDWRDLLARSPWLFGAFAERLMQDYDYVLIDSRSGVTDIGGICTMIMPDKLVTVFTPNEQSINGVARIIRASAQYRRQSDDFRPLVAFPLPSRLELSEAALRQQWRQRYQYQFEDLFAEIYPDYDHDLNSYFDEVQIPHVPYYAYGEQVAVLVGKVQERFSLGRTYKTFTDILVNSPTPWRLHT